MTPVERVLDRLEAVRQNSSGWRARCPSHRDENPSLSVREGDDGRVLVKCHKGCETSEIVAALGMVPRDLFPPSTNGHRSGYAGRGHGAVRCWEVRDAEGRLVARHHRRDLPDGRKRMWWTLPDGSKGLGGTPTAALPLYGAEKAASWPEDLPFVVV